MKHLTLTPNYAKIKAEFKAKMLSLPPGSRHAVIESIMFLIGTSQRDILDLCQEAGLSSDWVYRLVREPKRSCNINSLEAMANTLGYRIVMEKIDE